MTGHRCFGEFAVQASKLEMEFFKKMGVYKKVPRNLAKKMGCKAITTKCVDTNKVDTSRPQTIQTGSLVAS